MPKQQCSTACCSSSADAPADSFYHITPSISETQQCLYFPAAPQSVAGILFFWSFELLVFLILLNFLLAIIVDAFGEVKEQQKEQTGASLTHEFVCPTSALAAAVSRVCCVAHCGMDARRCSCACLLKGLLARYGVCTAPQVGNISLANVSHG
jgi:hypothetical protein